MTIRRGSILLAAALLVAACAGEEEPGPGTEEVTPARDTAEPDARRGPRAALLEPVTLVVPDMFCPACVRSIGTHLEEAGVRVVAVDLDRKLVHARYDPERMVLEDVKRLVTEIGYTVTEVRAERAGEPAAEDGDR